VLLLFCTRRREKNYFLGHFRFSTINSRPVFSAKNTRPFKKIAMAALSVPDQLFVYGVSPHDVRRAGWEDVVSAHERPPPAHREDPAAAVGGGGDGDESL